MTATQTIIQGDCLDVFRGLSGLGAIVSDPPSGTSFMGRKWDSLPAADRSHPLAREDAFSNYWAERLAVAHEACVDNAVALIWALPRTADLTMRALRLGGWHIQDVIVHVFGQGWPKGGAALKPAAEHWILARKGTPELGIDDCRVRRDWTERGEAWLRSGHSAKPDAAKISGAPPGNGISTDPRGSWPTNFVMSHSESCRMVENGDDWTCAATCECGDTWLAMPNFSAPLCECGRSGKWACPVAELDAQSGLLKSGELKTSYQRTSRVCYGDMGATKWTGPANDGGASRFFPSFGYYGKAPSGERHAGCEDLYWRLDKKDPFGFVQVTREEHAALQPDVAATGNVHPTVKRIAMMRWLHKLAASKGPIGDLCGGSGSGAIAAYLDDVDWFGAEMSQQAITIAEARLAFWRRLSPEERARFTLTETIPKPSSRRGGAPTLFDLLSLNK